MGNVDVIQRKQDTWNSDDRAGYLACFSADSTIVSPNTGGGTVTPAEFYDTSKGAFPGNTVKVLAMAADGETVAVEWAMEGTNSGPLVTPNGELPATGRHVSSVAGAFYTVRDGKIVATRYHWDNAALFAQLGLA